MEIALITISGLEIGVDVSKMVFENFKLRYDKRLIFSDFVSNIIKCGVNISDRATLLFKSAQNIMNPFHI